jgi:dihydrofolate reductase
VPKVVVDITMSLDGFVAGPDPTLEEPLGRDGERLHEWAFEAASWREQHGLSGGEPNSDSELIEEATSTAGAYVMGRKMFSGGSGRWEDDPRAHGWWGDEPPFHAPVFVLTHHARDPLPMEGGTTFTFVTEGIERAVELAGSEAGDGNVAISGGAAVVQQALNAGLVDELQVHVAPLLLGSGTRLFGENGDPVALEATRVVSSPKATHLRFALRR